MDDGQCGNITKKKKRENETLSFSVNPTKDLKYIGNKFLQNWSNSRKFMKSPNALKTQAKCGETFLGIFKKKVLKSWTKISEKRGNCNKKNIPTDFTFWHDQDEFFFKTQK